MLLLGIVIAASSVLSTHPGNGPTPQPTAAVRVVEIRMVDQGGAQWRFEPAAVEVHAGDTVRFIQADIVPHNVEFKKVPEAADRGDFVMGPFLLKKDDIYEVVIDDRFPPGEYRYVCTPHEPLGMVATLIVNRP